MVSFAKSLHLAASTRDTYRGGQSQFIEFCQSFDIEPFLLTEEQLCMVAVFFCLGHTVKSLPSFMSAVQNLFLEAGAGPLPRSFAFHSTLRGMRRLLGAADEVVRTSSLSLDDIRRVLEAVDFSVGSEVGFGAQMLAAFFFCLRTEDHCEGRLHMGDVRALQDGSALFVFPPGKSVRHFRHAVSAYRPDGLDLVRWLRAYLSFLPAAVKAPGRPLFVSFRPSSDGRLLYAPMSASEFVRLLKLFVGRVLGRSPTLYSGYSLRRGGTTELIKAGVPLPVIKGHVGWAPGSNAIFSYYDHNGVEQMTLPTSSLPLTRG